MKVVCIGAGPAGLYFSLLMKLQNAAHQVTLIERQNAADDQGWGVVLSDQAIERLAAADPASAAAIAAAFHHWDHIEIHHNGQRVRSGGHGFCGIARQRLLGILRERCAQLGVRLVYQSDVLDDQDIAARYGADVVVACDGLHSAIRQRYADSYQPSVEQRHNRYAWLGTKQRFDAFTFAFARTEHGWFQAHIYQYDGDTSTVIIEAPETVWRAAGLAHMSQAENLAFCARLFAAELGGAALLSKLAQPDGAAMWSRFPHLTCARWLHWNGAMPVVLMGDAAHSAHYSIGSGTRLALEDAIELAARCADVANGVATLPAALAQYQATRAVEVLKLQSAARNSMEWFENVARYSTLETPQFAYAMLTRSQRLSHENLRLRDPAYVAGYEAWLARRARALAGMAPQVHAAAAPQAHADTGPHAHADTAPQAHAVTAAELPILTPFTLRGVTLKNRIVVSPMAQYRAIEGVAGDYHRTHLGALARGGAALVFTEMCGVSADARITPACPGLYRPEHTQAWRAIVDLVHASGDARIAIQLGHAGPKGATRVMAEGMDQPLAHGGWPLLAASRQQYLAGVSQVASAATEDDMARIEADFVRATQAAAQAGFDWLELHCAHGYLLSSFISPLTNVRDDAYGGSLENRCRFPLRVFAAMRAAWPAHLPMSVRISAHDWVDGGTTPDDAVHIARLFKAAGADLIDCSSGQVSALQRPRYGRMYQTPFADRVRNEAGIASMAVGGIGDADQANGIIAAGRADLCAVGRPHLANPAWTLDEVAKLRRAISNDPVSTHHPVVPAQAGTHTPPPITRHMGPRVREDDRLEAKK